MYLGFVLITFNLSENSNHWRESLLEAKVKKLQPISGIFTEGDGIESRLPFKIFSNLLLYYTKLQDDLVLIFAIGSESVLFGSLKLIN